MDLIINHIYNYCFTIQKYNDSKQHYNPIKPSTKQKYLILFAMEIYIKEH